VVNGQEETGSDLASRWNLEKPDVAYDPDANKFDFSYPAASVKNDEMEITFYDINCRYDGTGEFVEYELGQTGEGIDVSTITMDPTPKFYFTMDVQKLANNENIYTTLSGDPAIDDLIATEDNGITDDDVGSGVMQMCVRFDIGYKTDGVFQSVNFIESILQIKYDLTVGFQVAAFSVAPKERITTTTVKDNYELLGYLCPDTAVTEMKEGRLVPKETVNGAFNQGALISVCVIPKSAAVDDGIIITSLTDYNWLRADTNITQEAIKDSQKSTNGLSLHRCETPNHYCVIESILFAEFFESSGVVGGTGNAQLAFEARRLSEADAKAVRRKLEEEDSSAEFDLSVGVNAGSDGPGALRTAGGASMGVTVVAALAGLVGASLLA